MSHNKLA